MPKKPALVKPLIRDYKTAIKFLVSEMKIELKETKTGALNLESIGWLKGRYNLDILADSVELLHGLLKFFIADYGTDYISATDLALYFRNERQEIKHEEQRISVVSAFNNFYGISSTEYLIDEEVEIIDEAEVTRLNDEGDAMGYATVDDDYDEFMTDDDRMIQATVDKWTDDDWDQLGVNLFGDSLKMPMSQANKLIQSLGA